MTPRTLRELTPEERSSIVDAIHRDAESAGWSRLNHQQRGRWYDAWSKDYDLRRQAIKDGVMKGFDARQSIPKKAEPRIQEEVMAFFTEAGIYVNSQPPMWTGKERADFVIGFSPAFPTHVVEIERADTWSDGLRQVLWYRAALFKVTQRHVQPMLILFGDTSLERFEQIEATCDNNHITLCSHSLYIDRVPETDNSLEKLFDGTSEAP